MPSVLQILITVSNEDPPTPLERIVMTVLYGTSAASANCRRLAYLSRMAFRRFNSLFSALFNDIHLNTALGNGGCGLFRAIPIGYYRVKFFCAANAHKGIGTYL